METTVEKIAGFSPNLAEGNLSAVTGNKLSLVAGDFCRITVRDGEDIVSIVEQEFHG